MKLSFYLMLILKSKLKIYNKKLIKRNVTIKNKLLKIVAHD